MRRLCLKACAIGLLVGSLWVGSNACDVFSTTAQTWLKITSGIGLGASGIGIVLGGFAAVARGIILPFTYFMQQAVGDSTFNPYNQFKVFTVIKNLVGEMQGVPQRQTGILFITSPFGGAPAPTRRWIGPLIGEKMDLDQLVKSLKLKKSKA